MSYQPGIHLIATLAADPSVLSSFEPFRERVDKLIQTYDLQKLGEVYHNFSNAGFTAVVCLSESHLSIHTWPEHGIANIDIYLSNFQRRNEGAVKGIYDSLREYFGATVLNEQQITR